MIAAELLADLTAQGFCLDVCEDGIGVVPASRLTEAQIQAIREHKAELLTLISNGAPSSPELTALKRKQRKSRKCVSVPNASAQPNGDGPQTPPASNAALLSAKLDALLSRIEASVQPSAPERTTCARCGAAIYKPKEKRCWLCGGLVDVPEVMRVHGLEPAPTHSSAVSLVLSRSPIDF
jgi:hypothetical protein